MWSQLWPREMTQIPPPQKKRYRYEKTVILVRQKWNEINFRQMRRLLKRITSTDVVRDHELVIDKLIWLNHFFEPRGGTEKKGGIVHPQLEICMACKREEQRQRCRSMRTLMANWEWPTMVSICGRVMPRRMSRTGSQAKFRLQWNLRLY